MDNVTQAEIDAAHGQAIGECDGCTTTHDGRPAHTLTCSAAFATRGRTFSTATDGRDVIILP